MKGTRQARHVATGNVEPGPAVVDKHPTWSRAMRGDAVERELLGEPEYVDCEPCGVRLQVYPGKTPSDARYRHGLTKRHRRVAGLDTV